MSTEKQPHSLKAETLPYKAEHYREWRRRQIVRMSITYLAPLIILIVYFHYRYIGIEAESRRMQLGAVAEHQANTLDLFLTERRLNLANLIDHPRFSIPPTSREMTEYLTDLKRISDAFVDLGFFDATGIQVTYAGPYPSLESRNYRDEVWFNALRRSEDNFVISDIYMGFRQQLHFTIAVSRIYESKLIVLRATLDPARMYEYIQSQQAAGDVITSIVNAKGRYQLVDDSIGRPLGPCPISVPVEQQYGGGTAETGRSKWQYAFRWLRNTDWCLIVKSVADTGTIFSNLQIRSMLVSAALLLISIAIILNRSKKLVSQQKRVDQTRAQLEHASKLASVGELAAGIAHEVNNPLAIITVESGLLMDYTDPQFGLTLEHSELRERLQTIQDSAFRCRDITLKLLRFVRRSDFDLKEHDIHKLIDGVIVGLLGKEIEVSDARVVCDYDRSLPQLTTDGNQLQQVILNIVNNARDAIAGKPGEINIATSRRGKSIVVSIQDNGSGMPPDVLEKLFVPFFTTKDVGKGTGLGLSVSYGIVRSLGGEIEVESIAGEGSTFRLVLPIKSKRSINRSRNNQ
ncbi:MAG: ATP-binding protein [Acidobacteria bacterium]|nr:ATP-binding protein [Acidobacteriota bacterium]